MIRINLLPVRQIKKRIKARQEMIALAAGFLLLLGVISLVGLRQSTHLTDLQSEITRLTQEKQQYQKIIAQIEKIKKEQAVIETKLAAIKRLKFASQLPSRILDEISNLTPPDRMWLTALDYTNNVLTMAGTALDNATIAEYMNKIALSDLFLGAELKNSSLFLIGNLKLKSFSMTINALAPASPAPVAPAPGVKK
ncbi:MAG: PilN domain-containing protein [Desulfobulbaceae bacterium]|nr:PilN domain-containing protein [Desulfobulbaceae bacterium]